MARAKIGRQAGDLAAVSLPPICLADTVRHLPL
jgi:hypothetical protein